MSESSEGGLPPAEESRARESPGVPHRVIGTPPPAQAASLLRDSEPGAQPPARRELPADPPDLARAKRAERLVAMLFVLAMLAGVGFFVAYLVLPVGSPGNVEGSNMALGGAMAMVFLALAIGVTIWVRHLMPDVELTEERHPMRSADEDRAAFAQTFSEGAETSQFTKRPLLRRTLIAASVPAALAPVLLLRDMGPLPGKSLDFTVWRKGLRLITYATNRPLKPADFSSPGSMITVIPDGYQDDFNALAKAAVIIIKFRPGQIVFGRSAPPGGATQPDTVVPNWTVDNIVAYSKICTHVGCPAALYEQTTMHILCPCHQSTFDAPRGAKVTFGPATRPLPQLPIGLDARGYLIATGDFNQPVGPSYWERGKSPA